MKMLLSVYLTSLTSIGVWQRAIAECGPIADSAVGCHVVPPQVTSVPASIGEILMKIMNTLPLPGSAYKRRNYQYDPATREHVEIAQTPTSSNNRPQCWEQHDLKLWANAFYYCLCSKDVSDGTIVLSFLFLFPFFLLFFWPREGSLQY